MFCLHISIFYFIFLPFSHQQETVFTHSLVLDPEGKFVVSWKPDFETKWITFEIQVETLGWIGLGFSPNKRMQGADIVMGWVDDNGQTFISDRYVMDGVKNGFPLEDDHQDYDLLEGNKNETHTTITITRMMDTCDEKDWNINEDTVQMIWAYDDNMPNTTNDFKKHQNGHRGVKSVNLLFERNSEKIKSVRDEDNVRTMDLMMQNVQIPNTHDTLYWCKVFQMPPNPKHHLIGYEMVIEPGHESYVHHMILYRCTRNMGQYANSPGLPCYADPNIKTTLADCGEQYVAGWAIGGEPYAYPQNVGAPLFGNVQPQYFMMEIHYDNTRFDKDIFDSSGVRLYVTPNLRPIEAGSLTLGAPNNPTDLIIPPRQKRFTVYSYCSMDCTQDMPMEGSYVFSAFLHTHQLGRKVKVRHIRDGVEQKPLFQDNHYDFYYQNHLIKDKPVKIMPGDEFIVECEYDSSKRSEATVGGPSTKNEQCFAFLEVYPRSLNGYSYLCMSSPNATETFKYLGGLGAVTDVKAHKGYAIDKYANFMPVPHFLNQQVNWNPYMKFGFSKKFQKFVKNVKHKEICYMGGNFKLTSTYGFPVIRNPYKMIDHCYFKNSNSSIFAQLGIAVQDIIG